jgi:hypothetical protein
MIFCLVASACYTSGGSWIVSFRMGHGYNKRNLGQIVLDLTT